MKTEAEIDEIFRQWYMDKGPAEFKRDIFDYQPTPEDIFVVSYPKCGSTPTINILWSLFHDGQGFPKGEKYMVTCPWFELVGKQGTEEAPTPRLIKTHLPLHLVPYDPAAKYVYVVRNPKDVLVSYFYMWLGFGVRGSEDEFDDHFQSCMDGKIMHGDYFDYILSDLEFLNKKKKENVLFLIYEEMRGNPDAAIRSLAEFAGFRPPDPELLRRVAESTDFKTMQKRGLNWHIGTGFENRWVRDDYSFIRKGAIGDWRNRLSCQQSEMVDRRFREKFAGTEVENWWPKEILEF